MSMTVKGLMMGLFLCGSVGLSPVLGAGMPGRTSADLSRGLIASTLRNSRRPTSHAATHVTGVQLRRNAMVIGAKAEKIHQRVMLGASAAEAAVGIRSAAVNANSVVVGKAGW